MVRDIDEAGNGGAPEGARPPPTPRLAARVLGDGFKRPSWSASQFRA